MKNKTKIFLSKKLLRGEAPTSRISKKSRKILKRFKRLSKISVKAGFLAVLLFFLSGYYPAWSFPPVKVSHALAEESEQIQKQEVSDKAFSQPINLPHPGYISTYFSNWHPGIDLATSLGTPIHPITSGIVSESGYDIFGLGNYVVVDHENGFKSKYAHMAKPYVKTGDRVSQESILGEVGLTGHTSGPHTHLEITHNGKYIDPLLILPAVSNIPRPEFISGALLSSGKH